MKWTNSKFRKITIKKS